MNRLPLNVLHAALRPIGSDCGTGAGGWELQLEGGAYSELALDVDLAGVLLHDSVADGKAEAGALMRSILRLGLRCEEWVVDAVEMFSLDAAAGVLNAHDHASGSVESRNLERCVRGSEHRILRVQHQVENDLLQLALISVNACQVRIEVRLHANLRCLELMLEQRHRITEQLIQVDAGELRPAGAREVEQAVDDLGGAEGLLRDLFQHRREPFIAAHMFGQHLGVAGDDRQRRIHLMRDASSQQADGGELLRLSELSLQLNAVGDVIDQNDAAHSDEVTRDQRRDRDVGDTLVSVGQHQPELVEGVSPMLFAHAVEPGDKLWRQYRGDRLMQDLGTLPLVHALHLGVPALDSIVEVDREDPDVDRFDDIFVELLQAFELRNLLLQSPIELRVLDGDADVSGQRFQQLHVFTGEKVAVVGSAEANDGDGSCAAAFAIGDAAGKIVVQVEPSGAVALGLRQTQDVLRILQEDVVVCTRPVEVEEANIHRAQLLGLQI